MIQHIESKGTDAERSEADLGISTKSNDTDFATLVDVQNEKLVMEAIAVRF